jgi:hypothetical protein
MPTDQSKHTLTHFKKAGKTYPFLILYHGGFSCQQRKEQIMKFKTTQKELRSYSGKKLAIGYCDAQSLLSRQNPIAYTCGVYGWNFDVYSVDGVTICTGYRGMVGKSVDYDLLREYETAAEKIEYDYKIPYEERKERIEALLIEFLRKAA